MYSMLLIIAIVILVTVFSIPMWRTKKKIERILVSKHRDFLRSLNIDGYHKLPFSSKNGEAYQAKFSVQLDGKTKDYNSIFLNFELLSTLDDDEINALCLSLQKRRRRFVMTCAVFVLAFLFGIAISAASISA